jgi:hypothetical protein
MKEDVGEEPIKGDTPFTGIQLFFEEGQTQLRPDVTNAISSAIEKLLRTYPGTIQALEKFYKTGNLPKFITIDVGTSHTGSPERNAKVAQGRINGLIGIITNAFTKYGVSAEIVKQFIVNNTQSTYKPSSLDKNFYDPKKVKPNYEDRIGQMFIYPITVQGLNTGGIQDVQRGLNVSSSIVNTVFVDGVDESQIVSFINKLQTYSDIIDLNNALKAQAKWSGLEDFLNDQLFDDTSEMRQIAQHLKQIAVKSGKQADTIRLYGSDNGYRISIGVYN